MKNDIQQIIDKQRVSMADVEQVFQVKLHPVSATTTKYVHVFEGATSPQAVLYDKVEFRTFANGTRFYSLIHLNGKVVMPEAEVEKMMGMPGGFEPANPERQEHASLVFNKNGKRIIFCYADNLKQLLFFTIEGPLQP